MKKEMIREILTDFCFGCSEDFANNEFAAQDAWKNHIIDTLKKCNKKQLNELMDKAVKEYDLNKWLEMQNEQNK